MTARDMLIDVLSDVDPSYIKEHMDRAVTSPMQRVLRYTVPAAIYAAACFAVLLILPHIIGNTPETPPTDTPVDPVVVETNVTAESEITEAETVTFTETDEVTAIETEEITVAPPTEYVPVIPVEEPVQTAPPLVATATTVVTTPSTTKETTTTAPEPIPEPVGMTHVTDSDVPYSCLTYSGGLSFGGYDSEISKYLSTDPVFTNAEDFRGFTERCRKNDGYYNYSYHMDVLDTWEYFNDEFFKEYNLYFNTVTVSSGSIQYYIDNVSVEDNGTLLINFNIYEPIIGTTDIKETLYLVAVKKEHTKYTANAKYRYVTYVENYNYYTGEYEYVLDNRLPERIDTYQVNKLPDKLKNDNFEVPFVMKENSDFVRFRNKVSDACVGKTEAYLDKGYTNFVSNADTTNVFWNYDYVYIGIYDSDYIYDNGKIRVTRNDSGVMEISVPVAPGGISQNTGRLQMYVLRFSKNILEGTKEIKIVEKTSTEPQVEFAVCSKCGRNCEFDKVWASSVHSDYKQSGYVLLFVKESITREIFKQSPDTTETVMEKYLSGLELDKMSSSNYFGNPGLVDDIINGRHNYALPISFTLTDKSPENITKVLSDFGCYYCSDFKLGGTIYG